MFVFFSSRYNTPWLWSPFTDMFSSWFTNCNNRCGRFELEALECMEYYGLKKGKIICKDIYEDFMECRWKRLEVGTKIDRWMTKLF